MNLTTANLTRTATAAPMVDMDTRLMLAHIAMDVLLSRHTGVAEARQAATNAIAQADAYSAEADRLSSVTRQHTVSTDSTLSRAGDLIRSRGWNRGSWLGDDGSLCLLAAVQVAAGHDDDATAAAVSVLKDRIRDAGHGLVADVPEWNDDSRRTLQDVLDVLR